MFDTVFPYTKLNELNLDWIMSQIKELQAKCAELEERVAALEGGG